MTILSTNENPFTNLSAAEVRKIVLAPAAVDGVASFVYAMVVASGVVLSDEQMTTAKAVVIGLSGNGEPSIDQIVTAWGEVSELADFSAVLKRILENGSK